MRCDCSWYSLRCWRLVLGLLCVTARPSKRATLRKLATESVEKRAQCDLLRVDARGLTWAKFNKKGLRGVVGVILTGLFNDTELLQWSRQAVLSAHGNETFHADNTRGTYGFPRLGDYIAAQNPDTMIFVSDSMLGAFGRALEFATRPPRRALLRDFMERPIFSVGVEGSMVPKHDSHPETWHALLQGSKAWFLGQAAGAGSQVWEDPCGHLYKRRSPPVGSYFCVQRAGEVLYFAEGVDHAGCSLEPFVLGVGAQGHTEQWPALLRAANRGDVNVVRRMARKTGHTFVGFNSTASNYRHSALHRAALHGHAEVVKLLLELRADAEANDAEGLKPIFLAAFSGHVNVVTSIVASVPRSVRALDSKGASVLQWAATQGHLDVVSALVSRLGADVRHRDNLGGGSMSAAATLGHTKIVSYLHSARANVHEADNDNMQPLHWAAIHGHVSMLRLLVQARSNPDAFGRNGQLALDMARDHGHVAASVVLQRVASKRKRRQGQSLAEL